MSSQIPLNPAGSVQHVRVIAGPIYIGSLAATRTSPSSIYRNTIPVVYAITDGEYVKVGWANNPEKRKRLLQCGNVKQLRTLGRIDCTCKQQAMDYERIIHKKYARYRIRGEWFSVEVLNHKYWKRGKLKSKRIALLLKTSPVSIL